MFCRFAISATRIACGSGVLPASASSAAICSGRTLVASAKRVRLRFHREPPLDDLPLAIVEHAERKRHGRESSQRIVLTNGEAKLGTRREEPIRLIDASCHQIVHEHADVRILPPEDRGRLTPHGERRIHSRNDALPRRFLVARSSVDLPSEVQSGECLDLERRIELRGRKVVVLDRVARARHARLLESRNRMQQLELDLRWQRRRQAIDVQLTSCRGLPARERADAERHRESARSCLRRWDSSAVPASRSRRHTLPIARYCRR